MKCLLSVCLVTIACAGAIVQTAMQSTAAPALTKGVSVQMASAGNAQPMPEADNADAWIITVTADGQLYFGADRLTPEALQERMIRTPRKRTQRLYIKADTRASFANVQKALDAASGVEIEEPVLLVSQQGSSKPGAMVPPEGLEVSLGPLPAGTVATVVQELGSGQQASQLKINDDEISQSSLESTLRQHFQKGDAKVILLKSNRRLPFGQVVQVIDGCRAAGATVILHPTTV